MVYHNLRTSLLIINYSLAVPSLSLAVNNQTYGSGDTINLVYPSTSTYQIACISANSKPDVNLNIFDSTSMQPLGNSANSATTHVCDAFNLCNVVYVVSFQLDFGSPFASMTSLTCMATSAVVQVNLDTSIVRKVNITSILSISHISFKYCINKIVLIT